MNEKEAERLGIRGLLKKPISKSDMARMVQGYLMRRIRWMQFVNRGFFDEEGKLTEIQSVGRDITERKVIEAEKERLISELKNALSQIKTLSGLLPICSNCKRIRNDQGYWDRIESYIGKHSNAKFTHGICPECAKKLYPISISIKSKSLI